MTSENIAVDNVKRDLAGEISDQDVKDVTQNSLTKKAKSLRKTHKSTQNESTLLDYRNNASTPNTLKRTRNVSTDAAPVTTSFNEGTSSLLHRHAYLHIAEAEKENRKLKTEVSDLKLQYLTMKTELANEKVRRVEIEQIWQSQKKILDEERRKFESERNDWEKERNRLLMDRDELVAELKKFYQHERHGEHENDSESQDDNSWNIISLTSGEESEFKNCYLITYHHEQ